MPLLPLRSPVLPSPWSEPQSNPQEPPLVVVTGASSGIGRAVAADFVQDATATVIGTSRDPERLSNPLPGVEYLPLDLGNSRSIAAFAEALQQRGRPAVLVNNAGESQSGPFEDLPREALERLFQVNVLGHVELTQRLLPSMRKAGRGRVVMVGSMLGSFPLAFRSSYVASKAAIKGFAFSLRREVRPYGVGVSVVEPGSINTGLSQRRTKYVHEQGPYYDEFATMLRHLDHNESTGISAETVAAEVRKAVDSPRPKPFYAVGSRAEVVFPLARVLPVETMHAILNRAHGLH